MYDTIAEVFRQNNWLIKIDDQVRLPTEDDIEKIVNGMVETLYKTEGNLNQIEVAHMIVQRNGLHFDLYVHLGDV